MVAARPESNDTSERTVRFSRRLKSFLSGMLSAIYRATAGLRRNYVRVRSHAALAAGIRSRLDASVVVIGPVEVHGSGQIRIGYNSLIYPGIYFETESDGSIDIGDDVVISRGVHIVSRASIAIGKGSMIGEYVSIRDANHARIPGFPIRDSGHTASPIVIGSEVWIGRGVTVLGGVTIGDGATVGANAVVTRDVAAGTTVVGVPARAVGAVPQGDSVSPDRA